MEAKGDGAKVGRGKGLGLIPWEDMCRPGQSLFLCSVGLNGVSGLLSSFRGSTEPTQEIRRGSDLGSGLGKDAAGAGLEAPQGSCAEASGAVEFPVEELGSCLLGLDQSLSCF